MRSLTFYSALFLFFMILQRGAGILTKLVLANTITPYEYGLITLLAITLPNMLQLVTMLFLPQILEHSEEGKNYFSFSLVFTSGIVGLVSVLLLVFQDSFFTYLNLPPEQWNFFYAIIVISVFLITITGIFQALFTGLRRYAIPSIFMALPSIARLVCLLPLLFMPVYSFQWILLIFALSNAIPLLILFFGKYRSLYLPLGPVQVPPGRMVGFGAALFIVASFSILGQSIIKIVVSHDLGITWQGYYDVSLTMATLFIFAMYAMSYISVPEATSSKREKIYEKGGLVDVTRALFALSLLAFILVLFYSGYFVELLFSEQFIDAATYLPIMAVGYLFLFLQTYIVNINLSYAKTVREYASVTGIALVMIPLFYFLTTSLIGFFAARGYGNGFIGAYVSYTIILVASTLLMMAVVKDLMPLKKVFYGFGRLSASCIAVCLVVYLVRPYPLIGIALSVALFLPLATASGYLHRGLLHELLGHSQG